MAESQSDTPCIIALKEIDDQFLARRKAFEEETFALQTKYEKEFKEFWDKRRDILAEGTAEVSVGTPACPGFWYRALKNVPELQDDIEEWDEDVLNSLKDITYKWLDDKGHDGFTLTFHFAENKYFSNPTLQKVYHTKEISQYTDTLDVVKVDASEINWRDGMDVTVETKKKKKSGGGKKKKDKTTTEPRPSFFRSFFRKLGPEEEIPPEVLEEMGGGEDDESDDDMDIMEMLIQDDHEKAVTIRDTVIGHAVRWYTGEAAPSDAGDSDGAGDDDSDDDDEDSDDDSDEDAAPKKGKNAKKGKQDEECKQQ